MLSALLPPMYTSAAPGVYVVCVCVCVITCSQRCRWRDTHPAHMSSQVCVCARECVRARECGARLCRFSALPCCVCESSHWSVCVSGCVRVRLPSLSPAAGELLSPQARVREEVCVDVFTRGGCWARLCKFSVLPPCVCESSHWSVCVSGCVRVRLPPLSPAAGELHASHTCHRCGVCV